MYIAHIDAVDEVKNTALAAANDEMRKRTRNGIQQCDRSTLTEVDIVGTQRRLIVGCEPVRQGQSAGSVQLQKAIAKFRGAIVISIAADHIKVVAAVKYR